MLIQIRHKNNQYINHQCKWVFDKKLFE